MEVEQYFGIEIPDAEAEKIYTIQSMIDVVAGHLNISSDNFLLRDTIFQRVKNSLLLSVTVISDIQLTDNVVEHLPLHNKESWSFFKSKLGLDVPKPDFVDSSNNKFSGQLKSFLVGKLNYEAEKINFETFVTAICANNYQKLLDKNNISGFYEIYVAIMAITVDKIGVDYYEIAPEKSFTSDLGVD
jgi:hypothetical protein